MRCSTSGLGLAIVGVEGLLARVLCGNLAWTASVWTGAERRIDVMLRGLLPDSLLTVVLALLVLDPRRNR